MKIKDIVNRDLVNLENCESEPIHIPGSIQPHGFLLGLKQSDFHIDFCTSNCIEYLGIRHQDMLGKPFEAIFGHEEEDRLKLYLLDPLSDASKTHSLNFGNTRYNAIVHRSGSHYIIDLEPFPDGSLTLPDLYSQTRRFVSYLERSVSLQDLCRIIADETRVITGYDRVMIYRFDEDYNGEVFAESKREDLESFFGLHYPHTDIPVQARQLYMRNLMRIIVDVNYTPVPIYTIDDAEGKNLDLSDSVLRSTSPIHVQYLQNIGVGATLTISLVHNKRLWGLIACHHYSAKNLPHYTRLAAQLQGHFLTSQINVREVAEEFDASQLIDRSLETLLQDTAQNAAGNFSTIFNNNLLQITRSSGAAFMHDGMAYTIGQVPPQKELAGLLKWLASHHEKGFYATSKLAVDYPAGKAISEVASGILFHAMGDPEKDSIIWFRQEVKKTVNWAGDPNKAIIKNEKGLSPRKSFELWKEITKDQSEPWKEIELNAAGKFALALQKQTYLLYLTKEENKYRLLSEKLQKANSELENINWISNHDLKEPVRKIQIFASKVLEDEKDRLSEFALSSVQRMSDSATRMQNLLKDISDYAHIRENGSAFSKVDLNSVIAEVKKELAEDIRDKQALVECMNLPVVDGIAFQLHQLFVNLVQNSLKFAKADVKPEITISAEQMPAPNDIPGLMPGDACYRVTLQDNGVGFDNKYADSIFQVFKRLHHSKKYKGTGIGLAICKKIMDIHGGAIVAHSEPDKGTAFELYFPKHFTPVE